MIILYSGYMAVKTILSRIWACTQVQYCRSVQGFPERHDKVKGGALVERGEVCYFAAAAPAR